MREKAGEKGLIGVVAELISVPKDYELALETVLGSGLQQLVCEDEGTDTDVWALDHGYISVVPVHADLTHYPSLEQLNQYPFHEKK